MIKERMRSDSFNLEFETTSSLFRKDSIDMNDLTLMREFSNNFENG
jgi:hypothetical protein